MNELATYGFIDKLQDALMQQRTLMNRLSSEATISEAGRKGKIF